MTRGQTTGCPNMLQSYFLYSALLALKLLALKPLAAIACNPDKLQRANLSDLKNLTPFWIVAALYTTTTPNVDTALALFRLYFVARCIAAIGYVRRIPRLAVEGAFFVSFAITSFMAAWVVYTYRKCF